jgi:hypothetical protein
MNDPEYRNFTQEEKQKSIKKDDSEIIDDEEKILEFDSYWKSADLLARQESCAAGIKRIDRMVSALKRQKPLIYNKLEEMYYIESKGSGLSDAEARAKADVMKNELKDAADHWCKTWSWGNERVFFSTPSPDNDDGRDVTILPFYVRDLPTDGCKYDVPDCELLKCYLCGGYITDPYISCAYECEHVIDAGSQVLFGRSAIGLDLYGVSGDPKSQIRDKAPSQFMGDKPEDSKWLPWFYKNYKHSGFLVPFYSFAPSHKCCNQVKSNKHFFGVGSDSADIRYINNSVEDLLENVEDLIVAQSKKYSCKELYREKKQIEILNTIKEFIPSEQNINIFVPPFHPSDMALYGESYEKQSIWVKWRVIDIIARFIKPLNKYLQEQVKYVPRETLPLVLAANVERQKTKKGGQKKTKKGGRKKTRRKVKKNKSRKSKKRH